MAERRMFAKSIIDSDAFLEMPMSTQCLYFHLAMRADDEGFVGNPRAIQRTVGASNDDMRVLIAKRFLLTFESGVVVIKHWKIHNYIQNDRAKSTTYLEEKSTLSLDGKKAYVEKEKVDCIQNVYIGKNSIEENSIDKETVSNDTVKKAPSKHKYGEYQHVLLTDEELAKLKADYGDKRTERAITLLDEAIEMKGYKYKSCYLAMRKWVFDRLKEDDLKTRGVDARAASIGGATKREYTDEQINSLFSELE